MEAVTVRPSLPGDVPAQRELWKLAFGDGEAYLDNFYNTYYRPERAVVLEAEGQLRAMAALFDTALVLPGRGEYRAGYLYAVATHPDWRGRGCAGRLLDYAGTYLRDRGFHALTTVPAQPSLHSFFGKNGFRECFVHGERRLDPAAAVDEPEFALTPAGPEEYGGLREVLLADLPHVALPPDALEYQAGCCRASGGGLYRADAGAGTALLCAEGMADGTLLVKELLGAPAARERVLACLPKLLPGFGGTCRVPAGNHPFGMLKWLDPEAEKNWDWNSTAYLGLAFD